MENTYIKESQETTVVENSWNELFAAMGESAWAFLFRDNNTHFYRKTFIKGG